MEKCRKSIAVYHKNCKFLLLFLILKEEKNEKGKANGVALIK